MKDTAIKKELQVLAFLMNNVKVCFDLKFVSKILPLMRIEPIPGGSGYVVGLMNIAGESIPVVDIALRLGLSRDKKYTLDTPILLCNDGVIQVGIVVDKVFGLIAINLDELQQSDNFSRDDSVFMGSVIVNNESILLMDAKKILQIHLTDHDDEVIAKHTLLKQGTHL